MGAHRAVERFVGQAPAVDKLVELPPAVGTPVEPHPAFGKLAEPHPAFGKLVVQACTAEMSVSSHCFVGKSLGSAHGIGVYVETPLEADMCACLQHELEVVVG